tara:strand:+ start:447 stop:566 length:120 start_codon:yes stop_codon:yes gene_type:complete
MRDYHKKYIRMQFEKITKQINNSYLRLQALEEYILEDAE